MKMRTKQRDRWQCMEITPVLLIARQQCTLVIFEIVCGMSEFLFIHSTISCGTLVGKN
jgi:hypothetical protein